MKWGEGTLWLALLCAGPLTQAWCLSTDSTTGPAPGNSLPAIISAIAAVVSCITAVASAIFAIKARRAENRQREITDQISLEIVRNPEFLDSLAKQGDFLRSTDEQDLERCLARLLARSDFVVDQIRNHERITGLVDEKIAMMQLSMEEKMFVLYGELDERVPRRPGSRTVQSILRRLAKPSP